MRYKVKDPQGQLHIIEGPEGATPDQIIAQAQKLIPKQQPTDWKGVVGSAVGSALMRPGTVPNKLMVPSLANAPAQAKALPPLASIAGGMSPIPGGSTMFGEGARALSDAALASYGMKEQIPSGMAHLGELAGNVFGDVIATPAIKKGYYGRQVGEVEQAAGVPKKIRSLPMTLGQKSTGDFINDAMDSVEASGGRGTPTFWKQLKDQVDRIYELGKEKGLTKLDRTNLRLLNQDIQAGLNRAVPGRAIPANALARSQTIPNAIGRVYKSIPGQFKAGAAYGTGATAAGVSIYELLKKLMGGG